MASFATPFFLHVVRMCTNHLAMKCNYYARLLNWNTVGVQGVFEESQYYIHLYTEEACEKRLAAL